MRENRGTQGNSRNSGELKKEFVSRTEGSRDFLGGSQKTLVDIRAGFKRIGAAVSVGRVAAVGWTVAGSAVTISCSCTGAQLVTREAANKTTRVGMIFIIYQVLSPPK